MEESKYWQRQRQIIISDSINFYSDNFTLGYDYYLFFAFFKYLLPLYSESSKAIIGKKKKLHNIKPTQKALLLPNALPSFIQPNAEMIIIIRSSASNKHTENIRFPYIHIYTISLTKNM